MKRYPVVFTPEARDQLVALYQRIATDASPEIALRYTDTIMSRCEALSLFPGRGTARDDIRAGLRITSFRKRTLIAFTVDAGRVSVIGIFHGGQDYEATLEAGGMD